MKRVQPELLNGKQTQPVCFLSSFLCYQQRLREGSFVRKCDAGRLATHFLFDWFTQPYRKGEVPATAWSCSCTIFKTKINKKALWISHKENSVWFIFVWMLSLLPYRDGDIPAPENKGKHQPVHCFPAPSLSAALHVFIFSELSVVLLLFEKCASSSIYHFLYFVLLVLSLYFPSRLTFPVRCPCFHSICMKGLKAAASWFESLVTSYAKVALLPCDLVTVEAISVQRTRSHV